MFCSIFAITFRTALGDGSFLQRHKTLGDDDKPTRQNPSDAKCRGGALPMAITSSGGSGQKICTRRRMASATLEPDASLWIICQLSGIGYFARIAPIRL